MVTVPCNRSGAAPATSLGTVPPSSPSNRQYARGRAERMVSAYDGSRTSDAIDRSGGRDEPLGSDSGLVDSPGAGIEIERLALGDGLGSSGRARIVEQRRLSQALDDHHTGFSVGLNVQSELGPQVNDRRVRRGDDKPLRACRHSGPQLSVAAEDPINRQQVHVGRAFQRERHPAEKYQRDDPRLEPETPWFQDASLGGAGTIVAIPRDAVEPKHHGQGLARHAVVTDRSIPRCGRSRLLRYRDGGPAHQSVRLARRGAP